MHAELEDALCEYLGVPEIALFNNGTIALLTALQALRVTGEVITTPYSFVATSHSLIWNRLTPVFVDIDPVTFNLDPKKIEEAITANTTAIMPVHCYGNSCDVKQIQEIADNYNLKVIYDAAHAFGVEDQQGSILNYGDLSVLSFHATKVFNTFEGGAIVCHDKKMKQYINRLKNFGIVDEVTVVAPGINGKMSEINAAFGLLQLGHMDVVLEKRKAVFSLYTSLLKDVKGIELINFNNTKSNYSYFPILVNPEYGLTRDELYLKLKDKGIFARRYFYPLISDLPMYRGLSSASRGNLVNAFSISERILCLPIFPDLELSVVEEICSLISSKS